MALLGGTRLKKAVQIAMAVLVVFSAAMSAAGQARGELRNLHPVPLPGPAINERNAPSAEQSASGPGPFSPSVVRKRFPQDLNGFMTRAMCRTTAGPFQVWWPERGDGPRLSDADGDCSTKPAKVAAAIEAALLTRTVARQQGFGSINGDRRGRGKLSRYVMTMTPQGPRRQRTIWPAGGSTQLDLFVLTQKEAVMSLAHCSTFAGFGSAVVQINTSEAMHPDILRGVVAHELFHSVQCLNKRLGLTKPMRLKPGVIFDNRNIDMDGALVEGTANWFAYMVYPQLARDLVVTESQGTTAWTSLGGMSIDPWSACMRYDLSEGSGYRTSAIWLAYLGSRSTAKRLKAAWGRIRRAPRLFKSDGAALGRAIGESALLKALTATFSSVCKDRIMPGVGGPVAPRLFSWNAPYLNDYGVTATMNIPGSKTIKIPPRSIDSILMHAPGNDGSMYGTADPPVTLTFTVTGGNGPVLLMSAAESIVLTPGTPLTMTVPPSTSFRLAGMNGSSRRAVELRVDTTSNMPGPAPDPVSEPVTDPAPAPE